MSIGNTTENGGTAAAAAPEYSARPAAGSTARLRASVVIFAMLASIGALWAQIRERNREEQGAAPPFKLTDASWRTIITGAAATDASCPTPKPIALLFVTAACPHCHAELQRWSRLLSNDAPQLRCVRIVVATAPTKMRESAEWLPQNLASFLLWDRDGSIARALHARLVPTAAFISPSGTVVARTVGEADEEHTLKNFEQLRRGTQPASLRE